MMDARRAKRDELFDGPRPTYEQFLVGFGYDQALTDQIRALEEQLRKGDSDE